MKTEESKLEAQQEQLDIPVVSGSCFEELLKEFDKYREKIAETSTISDRDYRLMAKAIWGCKRIVKAVERNYR